MTAACRWATRRREPAAGAEHLADRGQGGGGVVDHLEHAVAEHHVGAGGTGQLEQGAEVALLAGDLDAVLAGPAGQGGQGVGAGVDHGDPVAEPGHPDREAAGAAADVEDVEPGLAVAGPGPSASQTTAVRALSRRSLADPGMAPTLGRVLIPRSRGCGARACGRRPWCPRRPA